MAARNVYNNVAYGFSGPLLDVFPVPVVSTRDPGANDKFQLGTVWVNKATDDAFVLTSVVANVATWIGIGGGSGTFTSLVVNPGDVTVSAGNVVVTLGDITAGAGDISATTGSVSAGTTVVAGTTITAGTGITSTTGNIVATAGAVNAGTTMTAGTGITATTGNIVASAGNINATVGSITAGSNIAGLMIGATGDSGSGAATVTQLTNAVDTTQGVGLLTILSANGNSGTNTGFIKMYVGLTPVFVPYYADITP